MFQYSSEVNGNYSAAVLHLFSILWVKNLLPYSLFFNQVIAMVTSGQWRTEGEVWGLKPPPKFRWPSKIEPNSTRLRKMLTNAEFRTPTPQDVWKKCSKILNLPSVRNCFKLAMTNKLVVIINSLRVTKIKKLFTI